MIFASSRTGLIKIEIKHHHMKKLSIILFMIFAGTLLYAQSGINFSEDNWEATLVNAQKSNKLIFLDAYTSWCGPCKQMAKKTFTQSAVGDFYNENFINVKMDMEKGEGPVLAKRYNVNLYPTLLFINGQGQVLHRTAGYHDGEQFIELGKDAINPQKQLASMENMYDNGKRDPAFLLNYAKARFNVMDGSHGPIASQYLETQKDWNKAENMDLIFGMVSDVDSPLFDHLQQNKSNYIDMFGEVQVNRKINSIINSALFSQDKEVSLEDAKAIFTKIDPENADMLHSRFRMTYYRQKGDRENYASSAIDHYKQYDAQGWDELNETAWTFYEVIDDKKLLKKAVKLAKKSVKMDSNYYNNDTVAALYYKLGKKSKALKYIDKAIQLAKAAQMDYTASSELKDKIMSL